MIPQANHIAGVARHRDAIEIGEGAARCRHVEVAERGLQAFQDRASLAGDRPLPGLGRGRCGDPAEAVDGAEDDGGPASSSASRWASRSPPFSRPARSSALAAA